MILRLREILGSFEDRREKMRFILMLLFSFTLPFDRLYSSLLLNVLIAAVLIDLNKTKLKAIPRQVWIFQLVYFLGVIGYFYSYDHSAASFLLERQLAIILLPLVIPLAVSVNEQRTRLLLSFLAAGCVVALLFLFAKMCYFISGHLKSAVTEAILSGAFFNHQFSRPLGIHAGYLSLYVSMSVFYMVDEILSGESGGRLFRILLLIVLLAGLIFLASRNTIIATVLILVFIYPLYKLKKRRTYMLIAVSSLALVFLVVQKVPYLKGRFFVDLVYDIKPIQNETFINFNSAEPRFERWKAAAMLVGKSPLVGYGTGDEIGMLKYAYIRNGLYISYLMDFNAHNQYLSYLIKNGWPGLLIFLAAFAYYVFLALARRDFFYVGFLALLMIGFYTENILDANKGIFFFAFFNTVFGYSAIGALKKSRTEPQTK